MPPKNTIGIYEIRNIANDKRYVGSSVDIRRRWIKHRVDLRRGVHHSRRLQAAWLKYGKDSFVFNVLEIVGDRDGLLSREQHWIDFYGVAKKGVGYNVAVTAGSWLGNKHRPESIEKTAAANRGRKMSESTKQALLAANKGRSLSAEHRAKIGAAGRGRKQSAETIEKVRRVHLGRRHSEEARKRMSEAVTGRKLSPEHVEKVAAKNRGKKRPPDAIERSAAGNRGQKRSEEARRKMSEAAKRRCERARLAALEKQQSLF